MTQLLLEEKEVVRENRFKSDTELYKIPQKGNYNFKNVNLNDPRVWNIFAQGKTLGIFQLEKQLGQDWARKAKPRNIEELADLISILRPGVLETGQAETYIKRKNGEEKVEYFHPSLSVILNKTYGCLLYQEQSIKIAMELAGFSEVEGDSLRKGLGKKLPEVIYKLKVKFIEGCINKGIVNQQEAEEIFSWIEKGQRYLFNSSHAVSYAKTSYFSAYQKCHFTTEFYASWLTYSNWKPNPKEEIANLVQDAKLFGIKILPPDIRESNIDFKIIKPKEIIFGLSHIRGIGKSSINSIIKNKNFDTFKDLLKSVGKIKRNIIESLIKSGACDFYGLSRTFMLKQLHVLYGRGKSDSDNDSPETRELTNKEFTYAIKFIDSLGIKGAIAKVIEDEACVKKRIPTLESKLKYLDLIPRDTNRQKSIWEKLYLGLNLTCSAADDIDKIEPNTKTCLQVLKCENKQKVIIHVVIDKVMKCRTSEKSKNPNAEYARLIVSDNTSQITGVTLWPNTYENFKNDLIEDSVVTIYGHTDFWNGRMQIIVDKLQVIG